jgi:hypothetical protein
MKTYGSMLDSVKLVLVSVIVALVFALLLAVAGLGSNSSGMSAHFGRADGRGPSAQEISYSGR